MPGEGGMEVTVVPAGDGDMETMPALAGGEGTEAVFVLDRLSGDCEAPVFDFRRPLMRLLIRRRNEVGPLFSADPDCGGKEGLEIPDDEL